MTPNEQIGVSNMETQPQAHDDPFAEDDADNPFGDAEPDMTDPGDEIATEPVAQPATEEEAAAQPNAIPVVDKEGKQVAAAGPLETTPEDRGEQADEDGIEGAQEGGTPESEAAPAEEAPQAASAPAEAPQPSQEEEAATAAGGGQPDAAGGKSQIRYYQVLIQTGSDQWTVVDLKAAKDNGNNNVVSVEGKDGLWLAARNNDHALRLSWQLIDRPSGGATILPVPSGAWKPKRVKPKPVAPVREQLDIS